jgi:hypothetical protein
MFFLSQYVVLKEIMAKAVAEGGNRKEVPVQTKISLDLVLALPVLKEYHFAFV